ncbi:hypothetical protein ZWY2020_003904 [Hordeum vulgare]|nr:hypothetical protein ZWY2020_003904 [Hordeum vulgare]
MARMMGEPAVRKGPWTLEEDLILVGSEPEREELQATMAKLPQAGVAARQHLAGGGHGHPGAPLEAGEQMVRDRQAPPGRTDNEVKNYWRTRVHKKAPHQNQLRAQPCLATSEATSSASASASTSHASSTVGDEYTQTSFPYPELSWVAAGHREMVDVGASATRFFPSEFGDNFWNVQDNFWETLPLSDPVYEAL